MDKLELKQHELSGARLTVPFTALKRLGPKHHAIVLGESEFGNKIWIAELSRRHGYRLVELERWLEDNGEHIDGLKLEPNSGPRSNWEVAQSAIDEVKAAESNNRKYDVIFNNCETFADRHVTGATSISPQVKKSLKLLGFVVAGGVYLLKKRITSR